MQDRQAVVDALTRAIAEALPEAVCNEKWNAPNFAIAGRDMITLNLPPKGPVRVVFHRGAKAVDSKTGARLVPDDSGRLIWASDQRAYAGFADVAAVQAGQGWLANFCRAWVVAVQAGG